MAMSSTRTEPGKLEEIAAADTGNGAVAGRGGAFASLGAVGAALLSAICCAGPLLFVTFGVGAGLASTFEPFRPFFTLLTFALLALGFWAVYSRPLPSTKRVREDEDEAGQAGGPDEHCRVPRSRRKDKIILWGATVAATVFWSFPYWSLLLI